jgi:hypothetical protein
MQSKLDRADLHRDLIVGMELQKMNPQVDGYRNSQVLYKQRLTAAGDTQRKTLSNLWHARVYRVWALRKRRLVDSVGQALQGSNSCRGSSILEGTGSADRRIEKPTVTVKNISS